MQEKNVCSGSYNAIHAKAQFSFALVVTDTIGGQDEEIGVGSIFAACMCVFRKAAIWSRQHNVRNHKLLQFRSIIEAVTWLCDDGLDDHVCVSVLTLSCEEAQVLEALQHDFCDPMDGPVEYVLVVGTNKSQSWIFEQWYDERSCQSGSCGNLRLGLR